MYYVQVGNSVFIKPLTVKSCNFFGNVVVNFFNCSSAFAYQWVRRSVLFIAFRTSCKVLNVNSCFSAQSFLTNKSIKNVKIFCIRVSVQGVKLLVGHFACLCRGFEFYEVKKKIVIIFQKENGNIGWWPKIFGEVNFWIV